jgi:hypothetical protein
MYAMATLLRWRTLLTIFFVDDAFYIVAGATAKKGKHPGTLSDVIGAIWLIGAIVLVVLVVIALVRSSRHERTAG